MRIAYLAAVVVASIVPQQADAALYASTAAGAAGQLYIINEANGAVVQNVGPLNDVAGQNYPITGLAFHPTTGVLYGSTGNSVAATRAMLVTINPATARVTPVGSFNVGNVGTNPSTMADIGFDANGNLYGVGSVAGPQLYSINLTTAQATVIGATGLTSTTGGGIAINSAGAAYGTPTASRFGTYNLGTGAYTDIANPAKPEGGGYGSLDFNGSGVLYGLNVGSGSPPPSHLVTINTTTGAVTPLGGSVASLDAIAFTIPEPATLMVLPAALVFGAARGRRR